MTECTDKNCPKHNGMSVRGMKKVGTIVSSKARRTAVIELDVVKKISKYKRWARDKSRMPVHQPGCMEVNIGDTVVVNETRKISKTKAWVITEIVTKGEKQ